MQTRQLGQRQLFCMMRSSLEKRMGTFYEEQKDAATFIECAVAILVRHAVTIEDFSFLCRDLVREVFLTAAPCRALKLFSVFFESYFEAGEFTQVRNRLYKNEAEYLAITEETRLYKTYLADKDPTRRDSLANHQFVLRSIFKGENGRKHTWNLKKAHPTKDEEEISGALRILPMLSIFETNGVRKFAEFVEFFRDATIPDIHSAEEEVVEDVVEASATLSEKAAVPVKEDAKKQASPMIPSEALQPRKTVSTAAPVMEEDQAPVSPESASPPKEKRREGKRPEGGETREQIEARREEKSLYRKVKKYIQKRGKR